MRIVVSVCEADEILALLPTHSDRKAASLAKLLERRIGAAIDWEFRKRKPFAIESVEDV